MVHRLKLSDETRKTINNWKLIAKNKISDIEYNAERISGWSEDTIEERKDLKKLIKAMNEIHGKSD